MLSWLYLYLFYWCYQEVLQVLCHHKSSLAQHPRGPNALVTAGVPAWAYNISVHSFSIIHHTNMTTELDWHQTVCFPRQKFGSIEDWIWCWVSKNPIYEIFTFLLTFMPCSQRAQWWLRQLYWYDSICPASSPTQKSHGTHLLLFETAWNCKCSSTSLQIQISFFHYWFPKISRQGLTSVFYTEHLASWQNIHLFHTPEYTTANK